ncbi:hypothetical protein LU699_07795 [Luteimonas fraxinea]|uniref:DUF3558 domain-containing protein n=1 Tax=Luteimonas fraxinea TaxID=2901869 RepID=A0ABS8UE43_9GAMM|nr:hypothetical protein [Luteimonas fraxinea]MCD9097334.1 hypothetical protein [Luteimonas fraxinea]UHH11595.1 hypothetical protein LU699_07795 [Luteimonas fraxinea]
MSVFRTSGRLVLLAVAVCAFAACDKNEAEAPQPPTASGPQLVSAPPPRDALPNCPHLASALGGLVDGLEAVDDAGTRQDTPESYGISCAWRAPDDGAAIGAIVIVDNEPLTAHDMQRAGMYVEDPRVAALGGFVAIPDALLDGNAPLGPVGPQVIVGPVTVTLASNGRGRAAEITLDQAIDGAVAVHRSMR